MKTIIGISGSLRTGSFNAALLREAASSAVSGVEVVIKSIAAIPLYNGDEEEHSGIPPPVQELKDAIAPAHPGIRSPPHSSPGPARPARPPRRSRG